MFTLYLSLICHPKSKDGWKFYTPIANPFNQFGLIRVEKRLMNFTMWNPGVLPAMSNGSSWQQCKTSQNSHSCSLFIRKAPHHLPSQKSLSCVKYCLERAHTYWGRKLIMNSELEFERVWGMAIGWWVDLSKLSWMRHPPPPPLLLRLWL